MIDTTFFNSRRDSFVDIKSFLKKNKTASFWMDDVLTRSYNHSYLTDTSKMSLMIKNFKAIRNFITILTGKSIPVKYATKGDTYFTDGTSITVSADVNAFDITCGASLHEASHILLSDFSIYKNIGHYIMAHYINKNYDFLGNSDVSKITPDNFDYYINSFPAKVIEAILLIKGISNWIEDRRIDNYIIKNAPGYKGYYDALYSRYFFNREANALVRKACKKITVRAYEFYIVNSMNRHLNINALPDLKKILDLIDVKNISRLTQSYQTFNLAIDVVSIIYQNIPLEKEVELESSEDSTDDNQEQENSKNVESGNGNDQEEKKEDKEESKNENEEAEEAEDDTEEKTDDDESDEDTDDESDDDTDDDDDYNDDDIDETEKSEFDNDDDDNSDNSDNGTSENNTTSESSFKEQIIGDDSEDDIDGEDVEVEMEITTKDLNKIIEIIEEQEDFINHETKKKTTSDKLSETIQNLTEADVEIAAVGNTEVLIIRANQTPYEKWSDLGTYMIRKEDNKKYLNDEEIIAALSRGTQLGRKLLIRNEEKSTKYSRLERGKIENRQIYNLGYGNTEIFFQTKIDKYKNTHLHISIDASGSMDGSKFKNALTTAISIIKAASMTQNINVVVDLRCSESSGNVCVIIYDSRKDNISKVKSTFKKVNCPGGTPEAIVFDGLLKKNYYIPSTTELNSFFLNFSDGEPTGYCSEMDKYRDDPDLDSRIAYNRAVINKIRELGIEVISYFISTNNSAFSASTSYGSFATFKNIYGKDSKLINTDNISELAKTMNDKFLLNN